MRFISLLLLLVAVAMPAPAQMPASMSADEAYARAVAYMQDEFSKLAAHQQIKDSENSALKDQVASMQAALKELQARAVSQDSAAKRALVAFAEGRGEQGVDILLATAQTKADKSIAAPATTEALSSAEDFKRAGALAFAVDTQKAVTAYEKALALAPGDRSALNFLGMLKQRMGDLTGAQALYRAAEDKAGKDKLWQAASLGNQADVAYDRGDLSTAEALYLRALALDKEVFNTGGQAIDHNGLGVIALARGNYDAAMKHHETALKLNEVIGDKKGAAVSLNNLASVALKVGNLQSAETYLNRAQAINEAIGRPEGQATNLNNLSSIARERGDLRAAFTYQTRALEIDQRLGRKIGIAGDLSNLGAIAYDLGQVVEACSRWREAIQMYQSIGAQGPNTEVTRRNMAIACR